MYSSTQDIQIEVMWLSSPFISALGFGDQQWGFDIVKKIPKCLHTRHMLSFTGKKEDKSFFVLSMLEFNLINVTLLESHLN